MTIKHLLGFLFLTGCAGIQRDCSSHVATEFGSDWIIVQYRNDGTPMNCWKLKNVGVANETGTDGIYWQAPGGHLVHLSGWYNRVQVSGGNFKEAAMSVGVDESRCDSGIYKSEKTETTVKETVIGP